LLALHRIRPLTVIDLACGTGAAAVALARRKFSVAALDGSSAMLERAQARACRWEANVEWLQGDITRLETTPWGSLHPPFDLALCLFDSLNHLTDLETFTQAVSATAGLLKPGGHFFFDVNTPYAYAGAWGNSQDAYVNDRYARYWRSHYNAESGLATLHTTYFKHSTGAAGNWERIDTQQVSRGYDHAAVSTALARAGLHQLVAYEALSFSPLHARTYRAAYLTQKD
jgi:SAM-dependent methyltransferase